VRAPGRSKRRSTRLTAGLSAGLAVLAAHSWGVLPLPLWSCPIRHLTGVPCPTCFLGRSVLASLRGDLAGALRFHLFGPPLVVAALCLVGHQLVTGREIEGRRLAPWLVVVAVLGLLYWLLRLSHPALWPLAP
jgi:hypothetical protein